MTEVENSIKNGKTESFWITVLLRKLQKNVFFSGPATKRGRGVRIWPLRKNKNFFEALKIYFPEKMWPLSSRTPLREKVFKHEGKNTYIFKNIISNLRLPFVRLFTPSIIQIFQSCSFPLFHCFPYTCMFSLQ